jgi:hypothetical protein
VPQATRTGCRPANPFPVGHGQVEPAERFGVGRRSSDEPEVAARIERQFARQTFEISLLTDRQELHDVLDRPFDVDELSAGLSNETFLAAHP